MVSDLFLPCGHILSRQEWVTLSYKCPTCFHMKLSKIHLISVPKRNAKEVQARVHFESSVQERINIQERPGPLNESTRYQVQGASQHSTLNPQPLVSASSTWTGGRDGEVSPPSANPIAAVSNYDPSRAVHTQYTTLIHRLNSFNKWPNTHAQSPQELAVAGFFFTGIGDCVLCHYCGLGLKHWDRDDHPLEEHIRRRSSCGYLRALCGDDFIARTLTGLRGGRRNGEAAVAPSGQETVVEEMDFLPSQTPERANSMVSDLFLPCGHIISSGECANSPSQCPACLNMKLSKIGLIDNRRLPKRNAEEVLARVHFESPVRKRMNIEGFRVGTFLFYPWAEDHVILRLAKAGFYYTGRDDTLACFCCNVTFSYVDRGPVKDPYNIHRQLNPNCPHLMGQDEGNVFIHDEQTHATSGNRDIKYSFEEPRPGQNSHDPLMETKSNDYENRTPSFNEGRMMGGGNERPRQGNPSFPQSWNSSGQQTRSNYDPSRAVHTQYTTLIHRLNSFNKWPNTHAQSPQELAVAGFFFTGNGDCVLCHHCGLGLKHWDQDDRPLEEHIRRRSSCGYLRALCGDDFIARTLTGLRGGRRNGEAAVAPSGQETVVEAATAQLPKPGLANNGSQQTVTPGGDVEDLMKSEAAEAASAMGFPNDVIELLCTRGGRHAVITQILTNAFISLQARGRDSEHPEASDKGVSNNDDDDNGRREAEGGNSDENAPPRGSRSPSNSRNEGPHPLGVEVRRSDEGPEGSGLQAADAQPHNGPRVPSQVCRETLRQLEQENRDLRDRRRCKICLDNDINIVFLPCGHMVCCEECVESLPALQRCPKCKRGYFPLRIHLFSSNEST